MSTSTYTLTCVDCGREFIKTTKSTIGFEEQFQCPTCVCDHGSSQAKLTLIDEMATPTLVARWAVKKL
jgi:hypothetical protein